ncbi:MAG: hypothetical protein BGO67_10950 [Alphaproteobacteria bacterium 41-28]|nr:MAG: hypothetical protein BGO67_10950 [Alphaproteobacteria bacterium 41-28]
MKVLLATTMALGVMLTFTANQPANATVVKPSVSVSHQKQLTPARYYYYSGPGYYYGPGYGPGYYYESRPLLRFGPLEIF